MSSDDEDDDEDFLTLSGKEITANKEKFHRNNNESMMATLSEDCQLSVAQ